MSPAVGRSIWRTLSGLPVVDALGELLAGLEEEGCVGRVVRVNDTIDLGLVGLTAARLAGSGIGIGLQAKGTALIHRRDLTPLANLELYSVAPPSTGPLPAARRERRPARQGRHPRAGPQPLHATRRSRRATTRPSSRSSRSSVRGAGDGRRPRP